MATAWEETARSEKSQLGYMYTDISLTVVMPTLTRAKARRFPGSTASSLYAWMVASAAGPNSISPMAHSEITIILYWFPYPIFFISTFQAITQRLYMGEFLQKCQRRKSVLERSFTVQNDINNNNHIHLRQY